MYLEFKKNNEDSYIKSLNKELLVPFIIGALRQLVEKDNGVEMEDSFLVASDFGDPSYSLYKFTKKDFPEFTAAVQKTNLLSGRDYSLEDAFKYFNDRGNHGRQNFVSYSAHVIDECFRHNSNPKHEIRDIFNFLKSIKHSIENSPKLRDRSLYTTENLVLAAEPVLREGENLDQSRVDEFMAAFDYLQNDKVKSTKEKLQEGFRRILPSRGIKPDDIAARKDLGGAAERDLVK